MTAFWLCVSGGADSTAMALLAHERGLDFEMVFSDTGAELPETYWLLPRLAAYVGKPLTVVSNGTFFQHLYNYRFLLPSPVQRWCTRLLKQVPQDRFFMALGDVEVAVGIRADEAHRAKGLSPRWKAKHRFVFPLVDAGLDKPAVLGLCRRHGLLSPAYQWRSNTSCFCCPFQRKRDWLGLLKYHPDLYALAEDWEQQSRIWAELDGQPRFYTWREGRTLGAMRVATERQMELWPDPEDEPCMICAR